MFKRANKITALLVAAASVMSIVPAMAADTTRLGTKDGTIENAVAFGDGKYLFQGYKSDDNDSGLYYNDGTKDKLLDDATTFATTSAATFQSSSFDATAIKYGEKYAMAEDGNDEYVVDLATGKVSDEDAQADLMDNIRTKIKGKLTKTDRYSTNGEDVEIKAVDTNKFGETWYEFRATTSDSVVGAKDGFGFTTDGSKYIDVSNLANISVYVASNGTVTNKVVKVEEFADAKDGVTVFLNNVEFLAQDKDNIYVKTTVTVTGAGTVSDGTRYFVQKLSKAQGDKKDDAFLPKTVTSYEYDNDKIYKDDDTVDAYDALTSTDLVNVSVIDGSLYVTTNSGDNVKVAKLDLKKAKMDSQKLPSKENIDAYVVKQDDTADQDIAADKKGWSVDTKGYTWVIDEGKIYKFDKLDKKVVYTADRSLDTLDVYDESNLIAWADGDDVYTTVSEGKAVTSTDAAVVAPPAAVTGWVKGTDGTWTFNDATGTKVVSKWVNVGGAWYYLKADGIMATGWYNDNGTWYYLQGSGAMATGWLNDNGTWYYLAGSGAMLANTTVDGYRLGASGAWVR